MPPLWLLHHAPPAQDMTELERTPGGAQEIGFDNPRDDLAGRTVNVRFRG